MLIELMKEQPFPDNKHLASQILISRAYGQLGAIQLVTGMFAYFVVMAENGFWPEKLVGIGNEWDNAHAVVDVLDNYGQERVGLKRFLFSIIKENYVLQSLSFPNLIKIF